VLVTFEGQQWGQSDCWPDFLTMRAISTAPQKMAARMDTGTIFQLKPPAGNDAGETTGWTETILHSSTRGRRTFPWRM